MAKAQEAPYDHCLNCGQGLDPTDRYCRHCGQKRVKRKLHLRDFLQESLSSFFALDGRVFRTLKALFFKPGVLAQDFVNGKRARYFNPVRVYFLSSLFMIFMVTWDKDEPMVVVDPEIENQPADSIKLSGAALEAHLDSLPDIYGLPDASWSNKVQVFQELLSLKPELGAEEAIKRLGLPLNSANRFWFRQAWKLQQINEDDFEDQFNRSFQAKLLWILFLMLPLLGLVLNLLYRQRNYFFLEHLSFAFYQQSLLFLLIGISAPIPGRNDVLSTVVFLLALAHHFFAMRHFYQQGGGITGLKLLLYTLLGLLIVVLGFLISAAFVFLML